LFEFDFIGIIFKYNIIINIIGLISDHRGHQIISITFNILNNILKD